MTDPPQIRPNPLSSLPYPPASTCNRLDLPAKHESALFRACEFETSALQRSRGWRGECESLHGSERTYGNATHLDFRIAQVPHDATYDAVCRVTDFPLIVATFRPFLIWGKLADNPAFDECIDILIPKRHASSVKVTSTNLASIPDPIQNRHDWQADSVISHQSRRNPKGFQLSHHVRIGDRMDKQGPGCPFVS